MNDGLSKKKTVFEEKRKAVENHWLGWRVLLFFLFLPGLMSIAGLFLAIFGFKDVQSAIIRFMNGAPVTSTAENPREHKILLGKNEAEDRFWKQMEGKFEK